MSFREFLLQLSPDQVEALVEVMYLAADADGEVSADERAELASNIARITDGQVDQAKAAELVEKAAAAGQGASRTARLAAIKDKLPPEQRNHALMLAIKVTCADDIIRTSERELILATAEALDIPGDTAADLVKAVSG